MHVCKFERVQVCLYKHQCTAGTEYFHDFARIEYSHFFVGASCVEVTYAKKWKHSQNVHVCKCERVRVCVCTHQRTERIEYFHFFGTHYQIISIPLHA